MISCTWLICERSDRWRRAVDRFVPAMLPDGFERFSVSAAEVPEAIRRESKKAGPRLPAAAPGASRTTKTVLLPSPFVIVYELPIANPRETLQSIAACAACDHPPLQLMALDPELRIDDQAELELASAVRELGAAAVLRHPEHLPWVGRMVARYVQGGGRPGSRRL